MKVAHGGGDVTVSEKTLDCGEVGAGFKQVCGVGVAKRMDAAVLGDAGTELRSTIDSLCEGDVDRLRACPIQEQPAPRRVRLPVLAHVLEQAHGQRNVAVLGSLAL